METRAEAIKRGMARAKAEGKVVGRPRTTREPEIRMLLEAGWSQIRIRRHLKVGFTAVKRVSDHLKGIE